MENTRRYTFKKITHCNMCESQNDNHKILGKRLNKSQGKNPRNKTGITTTIQKCSNCGLIYSNPQPIPFDIQDHYGVPPESYWKDDYFIINENAFDHDFKRIQSLIDFKKNLKFLDVGAGLGHQMLYYYNKDFDVYGFEPSIPFYERAVNKMNIAKERLKNETIEETNYEPDQFDFISFGVVLEHIYDPSLALKKALSWLRPGGIIHIEVPSSEWLINKLINIYYKVVLSDYVGNISPMHEPYHLYEFSLNSFKQNGAKNNYRVVHYDKYVCKSYMPKSLDGLVTWYMKRSGTGMQLSVWLKKLAPIEVL
jgi:SAM-dependent methyltransferase